MRPYLRIFIGNTEMELPKDGVNLTLSYSVFDADDLSATGSVADRPIDFPQTKNNDLAFGAWYDVGRNNLDQAKFQNASAEVNGIPVLTGLARLQSVDVRGNFYQRKGGTYRAQFFGNNGFWIQKVVGLMMRDLDWSDHTHEFNEANVIPLLDADPVFNSDKYGYCIIKLKDWTYQDADGYAVTIYDCTPFLFLPTIFETIFTKYLGLAIDSNWLYEQAHQRFMMPFLWGDKLGDEYGVAYLNAAAEYTVPTTYLDNLLPYPLDFDTQIQTPPLAPTNPLTVNAVGAIGTFFAGVPNTTTYICPCDGYYLVEMSVEVGTTVSSPIVQIGVATNAIPSPNLAATAVTNPATGEIIGYTVTLKASAGDYIQPLIGTSGGDVQIVSGSFSIKGEAILSDGTIVDFKYLMKDWTVGGFLQGVIDLFNLKIETNVPLQRVRIEPLDDYVYTQRTGAGGTRTLKSGFLTAANDYTQKVDLNKTATVRAVSDIDRIWEIKYKNDGADETVKNLQSAGEFRLYEARYTLPANRFKESSKVIENRFFAPTIHTADSTIKAENSLLIPQVPLMWREDYAQTQTSQESSNEFLPRILWFGGQRGLDGNIRFYKYSSAAVFDTIHSACFAVNFNDSSGYDVSLAYSSFVINGNEAMGLMRRYYTKFMARKRGGKVVDEWLYLKAQDIQNLSFRPFVQLNGYNFLLRSVDEYNPTTNDSTKVVLEYDQAESDDDYDAFSNSPVSGMSGTYELNP